MAGRLVLLCACVVCLVSSATGKFTQGEKKTQQGWVYLDSFTSDSNTANFKYTIYYPRNYAPMRLLFYRENQFRDANDPGKSCEQKVQGFDSTGRSSQMLDLDTTQRSSGCENRYMSGKGDMVYCKGNFRISSNSGGLWYVVANRCGSQNGMTGMAFQYYIDDAMDTKMDDMFPFLSGQARETSSICTVLLVSGVSLLFA